MKKQKIKMKELKIKREYDGISEKGLYKLAEMIGRFCDNTGTRTPEDLTSEIIDNMKQRVVSDIEVVSTVGFLKNLWDDGLSKDSRIPELMKIVSKNEHLSTYLNEIEKLKLLKTLTGYSVGYSNN